MPLIVESPLERLTKPYRGIPPDATRRQAATREAARRFAESCLELTTEQTEVRKSTLETRLGNGRALEQHAECGVKAHAQQELVRSRSDEFAKQMCELKGAHADGFRERRQPVLLGKPMHEVLPGGFNSFAITH